MPPIPPAKTVSSGFVTTAVSASAGASTGAGGKTSKFVPLWKRGLDVFGGSGGGGVNGSGNGNGNTRSVFFNCLFF